MANFKDESTPLEFSAATSLSSLTIDDDLKLPNGLEFREVNKRSLLFLLEEEEKDEEDKEENEGDTKETEDANVKRGTPEDLNLYSKNVSQSDNGRKIENCDDNEKVLDDEEYSSSSPLCTSIKNLGRFEENFTPDRKDHNCSKSPDVRNMIKRVVDLGILDSICIYCTEGTPDGSVSNLSALSMPSIPDDNENIDHNKLLDIAKRRSKCSDGEDSTFSGDNDILRELIESEKSKAEDNSQSPKIIKNGSLEISMSRCNNSADSLIPDQHFKIERSTPEPSDDSLSLTEEDNMKLDQLIESAMPKRRLDDSFSMNLEESFGELSPGEENDLISSSQEVLKIKSPLPTPSDDGVDIIEENIKIYNLLDSDVQDIPINFVPSLDSRRSLSPVITSDFYGDVPQGRSFTSTTIILQPSCEGNSSPVPSEDSVSLTEEENIKLDQLIESAMPKRQNTLSPSPRSTSPKILFDKSNCSSPSRRLHSSSQSEILLTKNLDDFNDENCRLDHFSESGIHRKRISVSSKSSPVHARQRSHLYTNTSLSSSTLSYRESSELNRITINDFALSQEENMRLDQLIQSGKKRINSIKSSSTKLQDVRLNKCLSYSRPHYNYMRHNFFMGDKMKAEVEDDIISLTEEDNMKLDQLIESAMPKKHTHNFSNKTSSNRVLDDIPSNRILPYGCSSSPSAVQRNSRRLTKTKCESHNEDRNSLTEEENLRLDQLIESAMPKKRVNSIMKPMTVKVSPENHPHRQNSFVRSSNNILRRNSNGNIGKWKYYKRLAISGIARFIREGYP